MKVVILAAGLSTRLRPLTNALPKPMLPIHGKPILEHIVRHVVAQGFPEIIITTHFHPECIESHFGDGSSFGAHITYAHEDVLMNTAGSLKRLEGMIDDDVLIIGGNDFLPTIDLVDFAAFHKARGGIGTIAFKRLPDDLLPLFGQGVLDEHDRLVRFEEKPKQRLSDLIHTTYQIYRPRVFNYIPAGIPCSIPEYLIHRTLAAGEKIFGYQTESPFICVSTKELYEQASLQLTE